MNYPARPASIPVAPDASVRQVERRFFEMFGYSRPETSGQLDTIAKQYMAHWRKHNLARWLGRAEVIRLPLPGPDADPGI